MNIVGKFVCGRHPHFGTLGLKMVGREHFDPLGPMAVAHDLFEHFEDDDGSPEHELLAIGASWFVRDHGKYLEEKHFPRFASLIDHLAANIRNVRDELKLIGRGVDECPQHIPNLDLPAVVSAVLFDTRGHYDMAHDAPFYDACVPWLKWGYVRAADRYSPSNAPEVCTLFGNAEDLVADWLCADGRQEGDTCTVTAWRCPSPAGLVVGVIG